MAAASTSATEAAKGEMEASRVQVMECENEIQSIKTALRQLGTTSEEGSAANSLEISAIKVTGLPDTAQPQFVLQLSSPVEEATLTKLLEDGEDSTAEGTATVVFKEVETSVATLVVTAKDMDIPLGVSAIQDVSPLCRLNAMEPQTEYVSEVEVAILAEDDGEKEEETLKTEEEETTKDVEAETKSETESGDEDFKDAKEEAEETKEGAEEGKKEDTTEEVKEENKVEVTTTPVCTVTFRVTFKPSTKDKREELYDMLNKASQRKAQAIDRLRKSATAVSRAGVASTTTTGAITTSSPKSPAVKSGFLNKKKEKPTRFHKIVQLYEKTLGPESLARKIYPVAKNYVVFFGAALFFHFKGHLLALPPPV